MKYVRHASDFIPMIKGLSRGLLEGAAPLIADALRAELSATITSHETPDGKPWAPRKRGYAPVLNNAVSALRVTSDGTLIVMTILGIEARHNHGWVRGGTKRQMIPSDNDTTGLPPRMVRAIQDVLTKEFNRISSGGGAS